MHVARPPARIANRAAIAHGAVADEDGAAIAAGARARRVERPAAARPARPLGGSTRRSAPSISAREDLAALRVHPRDDRASSSPSSLARGVRQRVERRDADDRPSEHHRESLHGGQADAQAGEAPGPARDDQQVEVVPAARRRLRARVRFRRAAARRACAMASPSTSASSVVVARDRHAAARGSSCRAPE